MIMLDASKISVEQAPGGAVQVRLSDGQSFQDVAFVQLFPHSDPQHFLSVRCAQHARGAQGADYVEIGILKDMGTLPASAQKVVFEDIRRRYFFPLITDIVSIKTKSGADAWVVETDRGRVSFTVRDRGENVVATDQGAVIITDIDKCRYKIPDYRALPPKSRAVLERVLL